MSSIQSDAFLVLKKVLKARGWSYAQLGQRIGLSEPSVKRIFAGKDCRLSRMIEICAVLDVEVTDVFERAERTREEVTVLPVATEHALAATPLLFYVFILMRDRFSQRQISQKFNLDDTAWFRIGQKFEELGLAELLPENVIRLNHKGAIRFRTDGPLLRLLADINQRFLAQTILDNTQDKRLFFTVSRRMLPDSAVHIVEKIDELQDEIAELARQDQLIAKEADLQTFKLTGAWGDVDFSKLMKV